MERVKKVNESPETTPNEIDSFLRDLNLTELIGIFQREKLTMEDILKMDNNELNSMLKSIGVEKFKQRKAIVLVILCQRHSNYTANVYRDYSAGKSECRDFKFIGIAGIPAIPVILKSSHSDFNVKIAGILTLQVYYRDSLH